MLTVKQAFSTAAALRNDKTQVKLCEACPMHDLHKLCERIEGKKGARGKMWLFAFNMMTHTSSLCLLIQLCTATSKSDLKSEFAMSVPLTTSKQIT